MKSAAVVKAERKEQALMALRKKYGTDRERKKAQTLGVLRETGWNLSESAAVLGITRGAIHARLKQWGVSREQEG